MTPPFLANEHRNIALTEVVTTRNLMLAHAGCIEIANFKNNLRRQFRHGVAFTVCHLSFIRRVSHVLKVCSEKQMIGPNAPGIVAARTIVANLQAIRNRAVRQLPRHACWHHPAQFSDDKHTPALCVRIGNPYPASIRVRRLADLLPKPFSNGPAWGSLGFVVAVLAAINTVAASDCGRLYVEVHSALATRSIMLWMRHSLTSSTGRGVRRGRGVCSVAGLSLCLNYTAKAGYL